jgi:hypothetical protein
MIDAPVINLRSLGQNLLNNIKSKRQSERNTSNRRIVFVAHSHGGLVVKEALVIDYMGNNDSQVAFHTDGIVFLGTPHQGSSLTYLGRAISIVLRVWGSNDDILRDMAPRSKYLSERHGDFTTVLRSLKNKSGQSLELRNFVEECPTTVFDIGLGFRLRHIVVAKESATLRLSECDDIPIQRDHRHLNKFSERDNDYKKVLGAIKECFKQPSNDKPNIPNTKPLFLDELKAACFRSLAFSSLDARKYDVKIAHKGTCEWLFQMSEFDEWINLKNIINHNGVLWIKGKAGAGKSTLMKHIFSHCQSMCSHSIIAYFFNARGIS